MEELYVEGLATRGGPEPCAVSEPVPARPRFGLELHPGKTRLVEFGRYAAPGRKSQGPGEAGDVLVPGVHAHLRAHREGTVPGAAGHRQETAAGQAETGETELMRRRHLPGPEQGRWLRTVITGHQNYYAMPGNYQAVRFFRTEVTRHWRHALSRRSQKGRVTWERMDRIARHYLPRTRITHPYPEQRFAAAHPWQEPSAVIPLAGICAGDRP